jgi:ADP-heptose:LPS heptosyltransferase
VYQYKPETILSVDRHLGGVLNACCRVLKPFLSRFQSIKDPQLIRHVVVAKYIGLGSVLLTNKLLKSLSRAYPQARITFVTFESNSTLLKMMDVNIDKVITISTDSFTSFIKTSANAIKTLSQSSVDMFLDLEFYSRYSALMSFCSLPRSSVGYESLLLPHRTALYSHPAKYIPQSHVSENFTNQLRTVGSTPIDCDVYPRLRLSEDSYRKTKTLLAQHGVEPGNYIVCNPNASEALGGYRKWPVSRWVELISELHKDERVPILLPGLEIDKKYIRLILDELSMKQLSGSSVLDLSGQLGLSEYIGCLDLSRKIVTVDSGTYHICMALNKPTVVMFGPETPLIYGVDVPNSKIIYKKLFCSPCYNIHHGKKIVCRNEHRCMSEITTQEVMAAVRSLQE